MSHARLLSLALIAAACGGPTPTPDAGMPTPLEAQLLRGSGFFAARCAHCHGEHGEGGVEAPPLVGGGALPLEPRPGATRSTRFETAADVLDFMATFMPGDAPGSLSESAYLALLAFLVTENGIALEDALTPEAAADLLLAR